MTNLVVIVTDTLRRLDSVRGLDLARDAPFLRDLVESSLSLEKAIAASPWSLPSHWCILSGVQPWRAGQSGASGEGPRPPPNLARYWSEIGGSSVSLSENDLVSQDAGLLRDYSSAVPNASVRLQRAVAVACSFADMGMGVTARTVRKRLSSTNTPVAVPRRGAVDLCYSAFSNAAVGLTMALSAERASQTFLHEFSNRLRKVGSSKPIHAFVNLMGAHEPYVHSNSSDVQALSTGLIPTNNLSCHTQNLAGMCTDVSPLHAAYRRAIRELDSGLREVFGVLRRTGVLDDALVLLLSDHGQSLGENGYFGHRWTVQDEVVKIPAYIWDSRRSRSEFGRIWDKEWVDHRHLHDVLVDQVEHSGKPIESSIREVLDRRGPALSYFRGRPPAGFNLMKRVAPREKIRLWLDDSEVEMGRRAGEADPQLVVAKGDRAAELETWAVRALRDAGNLPLGPDSAEESSKTFERLESWGYS